MKWRLGFHPPETEFTWGEGKEKNTYVNDMITVPGCSAALVILVSNSSDRGRGNQC